MAVATITAKHRTAHARAAGRLRKAGEIPAVVYGRTVPARAIAVRADEFRRVARGVGESTIFQLAIEGAEPLSVLIQEVAEDPITSQPIHVDFHAVAMDEEIHARIPIVCTGVAPAVQEAGGVLVKPMDHLEVRALPMKLVPEIVVDVSVLATLDDAIHVRDLTIPEGIVVLTPGEVIVAKVTEVREEVEETPVEVPAVAETASGTGTTPEGGATPAAAATPDDKKSDAGKKSAKKKE